MKRLFRQLVFLTTVVGLLLLLANFVPAVGEVLMAPISLAQGLAVSVEIQQIQSAVVRHVQTHGGVPAWNDAEFRAFVRTQFQTRGRDPSLDFWGHPYHYSSHVEGRSFRITSFGPDGRQNTADDMQVEWRVVR